jgi:hypothetical protein
MGLNFRRGLNCHPGKDRDPCLPWAPAFAGVAKPDTAGILTELERQEKP